MDIDLDISGALEAAGVELAGWVEGFIQNLPNLAAALLLLFLFWIGAKLARRTARRVLGRISPHPEVNRLLAGLAAFSVLAAGLFIALGVLDLDKTVTSLLAGAGIIALAVGFAAQDSVENLISGVLISVRRPFREGELVETGDLFGTVEELNLRTTILRLPQGQLAYVPNGDVLQEPLMNHSRLGRRRVDLDCGVAYGDDLEEAKRIAVEAIEGVPGRDPDREVELFYREFGGSSVDFVVRFWIDSANQTDFLSARSEAIQRLKRAFDRNGITIPFPIRTLDFGVVGGRRLADELGERTESAA